MAEPVDPRLSQLATDWSAVQAAHDPAGLAPEALARLLLRYKPAVDRYLAKLAGDADLAEELAQEFALRFVRGDFRHVRPGRGRFRDYLKAALRNLVHDHHRRRAPGETLPPESQIAAADTPFDDEFNEVWKDELVMRAWAALREDAEKRSDLSFEALKLKADDPRRRSEDVAALLTERAGRPVNAAAVRQLQHRARERFAAFLRQAVRDALPPGDAGAVDEELAELGLLAYVTPG